MKITCGLVLFNNKNQILVCHPTGAPWNVWSIPKGLNEKNETFNQTVKREVFEETTLLMYDMNIIEINKFYLYHNKKKKLRGFYYDMNKTIHPSYLKCISMVKNSIISPFPEVDSYSWMNLHETVNLHETQYNLINDILTYKKSLT